MMELLSPKFGRMLDHTVESARLAFTFEFVGL
jgi:hypothetical protein